MPRFYDSMAWRRARRAVLRRAWRCARCGAIAEHVDHIVPIADGGALLDAENLQPLCAPCHNAKSATERAARDARGKRQEPTFATGAGLAAARTRQ